MKDVKNPDGCPSMTSRRTGLVEATSKIDVFVGFVVSGFVANGADVSFLQGID